MFQVKQIEGLEYRGIKTIGRKQSQKNSSIDEGMERRE